MRIVARVLINAVALWAAASLIDGITLSSQLGSVLITATIFGIVNALLQPTLKRVRLPFVALALGVFTLIVNAVLLSITDALSDGISIDGFWNSILGAAVVSIVSWALSVALPDN